MSIPHKTIEFRHQPVLMDAVLEWLKPQPGKRFLDGTVGGAGHAVEIAKRLMPGGFLWALDCDAWAVETARTRLQEVTRQFEVVHANFRELADVIRHHHLPPLDGILLDLGVSSPQLDTAERGFSFQKPAPLDMRLNPESSEPTAADLINTLSESQLADLIWRYGDEHRSRAIARLIVQNRPVTRTDQLAGLIQKVVPKRPGASHPATRTFQALRIAVNHELESLEMVLPVAVNALAPGGRLGIITFHSLEDRMVKQFFRQQEKGCVCPPRQPICTCGRQPSLKVLTPRGIAPTSSEIASNPRSRSARLRVAERVA